VSQCLHALIDDVAADDDAARAAAATTAEAVATAEAAAAAKAAAATENALNARLQAVMDAVFADATRRGLLTTPAALAAAAEAGCLQRDDADALAMAAAKAAADVAALAALEAEFLAFEADNGDGAVWSVGVAIALVTLIWGIFCVAFKVVLSVVTFICDFCARKSHDQYASSKCNCTHHREKLRRLRA
jgi:hypothetical protein